MSAPTTPLEDGGAWATLPEGDAFMATVILDSGRVTRVTYGVSAGGYPLHAYRVGGTASPVLDAEAPMLVVGSQHGNEPSGREAALRTARDLAYTQDPNALNRLAAHPVVIIPTANPDGIATNSRENADGDDMNRGHIDLSRPESKALAALIQRLDPILIIDAHEKHSTATPIDFKAHEQVAAPPLRDLGASLVSELIALYPSAGIHPENSSEGTLVNASVGRGIPAMLTEVQRTLMPEVSTAHQLVAIQHLLSRVPTDYVETRISARAWHRNHGFEADELVYAYGSGWLEPAHGYLLQDPESTILDAFGIRHYATSTDSARVYVPMDQDASPLIPLLLDPNAPRPAMVAIPVRAGDVAIDLRADALHLPSDVRTTSGRPRRIVTQDGIVWGT